MTSEVCIMNRLAVVLAADSATTVTRWDGTKQEQRYFKGANKIFQLSNFEPVGVMIFDSAALLGVPWEVVIKEFRGELGDTAHDTVEDYAAAFFSFLDSNTLLFPKEVRQTQFAGNAKTAAIRAVAAAAGTIQPNDPDPAATANTALNTRHAELEAMPFPACSTAAQLRAVVAAAKPDLVASIRQFLNNLNHPFPGDIEVAAEIGLMELIKEPDSYLSTTGIVFAGFGRREVFPSVVEYQSCSFIWEDHASLKKTDAKIDHNVTARLIPFAQSSMAETFRMGVSQSLFISLMQATQAELAAVVDAAITASGGDAAQIPDLAGMLSQAHEKISQNVLDQAGSENALPLQRVIGSLPIDEMANLAETLINLQSLKERVTKPSETVGGPVDVAAITRSEGLVWIKRKHYFPDELNRRFQQRQNALYK